MAHDGYTVIAAELRRTSGRIDRVFKEQPKADLTGSGLGDGTHHDRLGGEFGDFIKELDKREKEFRQKSTDCGDDLERAAHHYEHSDDFLSHMWIVGMGGGER